MEIISETDLSHSLDLLEASILAGRSFVAHPSHLFMLKYHRHELKQMLREKIAVSLKHGYRPDCSKILHIPKSNDTHLREVALHSLSDELFFTWVSIKNFDAIQAAERKNSSRADYSRPLPIDKNDTTWVGNFIEPYLSFEEAERDARAGGKHVLALDIKSISENIDAGILEDIIVQRLSGDPISMSLFYQALKSFQQNGVLKGLNEGSVSADLMLKAYLQPFDADMKARFGDKYFRYVDDMRIVLDCPSEAAEIIEFAEQRLSELGLSLNPEKTQMRKPRRFMNKDQEIITQLDLIGYRAPQSQDGSIDVSTLSSKKMRDLYQKVILPGLETGNPKVTNSLVRRCFELMGDLGMKDILQDYERLSDLYPDRSKYLIYYLQRGGFEAEAMPKLVSACEKKLSGYAQYFTFKTVMKYYVQKPMEFYEKAVQWSQDPSLPKYMKHFAQDVLETRNSLQAPQIRRIPAYAP